MDKIEPYQIVMALSAILMYEIFRKRIRGRKIWIFIYGGTFLVMALFDRIFGL